MSYLKANCENDLTQLSTINQKIVQIIRPFMKRFMKNFSNEFVDYWLKLFHQDTNKKECNLNVTLKCKKIINILILCWPNPEEFIDNIAKSEDMRECIRQNEFVKKNDFRQ